MACRRFALRGINGVHRLFRGPDASSLGDPFDAAALNAALPVSARKIAVLDRTKEPGALGGPLMSPMSGEPYFVELTKKTPPTDADWADLWPKEEKELRDNALTAKRNQMLMDYVIDLRGRVAKQGSPDYVVITKDLAAMNKILAPEKTESTEEDTSLPSRPPRTPSPRPMDFGPPASE